MTEADSGVPLARVSYLPGATPPESASVPDDHGPNPDTTPSARDNDGWYVEPSDTDSRRGNSASGIAFDPAPLSPSTGRRPTRSPVFVETPDPDSTGTPSVSPQQSAPATGEEPTYRDKVSESPAVKKMRLLIEAAEAEKAAADKPVRRPGYARANEPEELGPESAEESAARAENISMSALTRKGMSSWEMAERLRVKDLDEETVLNEVARLERVGLLNDRDLAETLVRTLQDRKGLGRSGITAELRRRHVDPEAIEEALDALDGDDELARATEIALKRAPQLRSLDMVTAKRRLGAFLMRKGYNGSVISAAVTAALEPARGPRFR